jgi:UDP-2,3-diacylglucosamine pyrophosphatase LpxH
MIIIVSDLHLTDTIERSTLNEESFFESLNHVVTYAVSKGITDLRLILLGDVFEILKSEKWLEATVRPWEECDSRHSAVVDKIFASIISSNASFLQKLKKLSHDYKVRIEYVPGNHDLPLNTEMGQLARQRLRQLGLLTDYTGGTFKERYEDAEHGLLALHGHTWDPANRYGEKTVPIGDAIVIDMVQQLPVLVAQRLGLSSEDDQFGIMRMLHEMDNIRPHTLRVIAQWINGGLSHLENSHPKICKVIDESFTDLVERILDLQREVPFETFAVNRKRLKLLSFLVTRSFRKRGFLKVALRLPSDEDGAGSFRDRARREFKRLPPEFKYIVCGHTHHPMVVPIHSRNGDASLYMNTGTWRRVRPVARSHEPKSKTLAFGSWEEECLVTIFNAEEQQKYAIPAFNFYRLTRGN